LCPTLLLAVDRSCRDGSRKMPKVGFAHKTMASPYSSHVWVPFRACDERVLIVIDVGFGRATWCSHFLGWEGRKNTRRTHYTAMRVRDRQEYSSFLLSRFFAKHCRHQPRRHPRFNRDRCGFWSRDNNSCPQRAPLTFSTWRKRENTKPTQLLYYGCGF
jgi:hypothetical protein